MLACGGAPEHTARLKGAFAHGRVRKTYLAIAKAVEALESGRVGRIVLVGVDGRTLLLSPDHTMVISTPLAWIQSWPAME